MNNTDQGWNKPGVSNKKKPIELPSFGGIK